MIHPNTPLALSPAVAVAVPEPGSGWGVGWGQLIMTWWLSSGEASAIPPEAPDNDTFRFHKPKDIEDNVHGGFSPLDHTWSAAHALRQSALGTNGMHLIRGQDPFMEGLADDDSDIDGDY